MKTPVFVRFSTVAGFRGSADTVRDVRGFAVKFYTEEGNYDLVGNNIPVFFIQDGIKFPDIIHAVKREPHNEMPQAGTAHSALGGNALLEATAVPLPKVRMCHYASLAFLISQPEARFKSLVDSAHSSQED